MADTVPQHFTTEFSTNWIQRAQQTGARLDAFVEEESFMGERKSYDRIGAQNSRKRTERKGPTQIQDFDTDKRWIYRESYELPNLLDKDDAINLGALTLPTSDLVKSHANAFNRDKDDVAWQAAIGSVMTGELGATPYALQSSQKVVHGSTGLTIAKLIAMNQILEDADLEDGSPRVLVVTAKQIADLLGTTEVKSADYNNVKALVNGTVDTFMGFKFVKIKRLTKVGSTRYCPCWVKGAIKRTVGQKSSDISIRKDLSMATQIYSSWHLGATRVYDEGVGLIECTE